MEFLILYYNKKLIIMLNLIVYIREIETKLILVFIILLNKTSKKYIKSIFIKSCYIVINILIITIL